MLIAEENPFLFFKGVFSHLPESFFTAERGFGAVRVCRSVCVYLCTRGCVLHKRIPLRLALSNFQIVIMPLLAHCGDKTQNVMNYFIITIKYKPLGRLSADVACDSWWLVAVFILARFGWLSSQSLRRLISHTNDCDTNVTFAGISQYTPSTVRLIVVFDLCIKLTALAKPGELLSPFLQMAKLSLWEV